VNRYWEQYLRWRPDGAGLAAHYYEAFSFGSSPESARLLADLVLRGIKTATGSLLWVYEVEGKPIPKRGDLSIVTDGSGVPVCIIEDTEVRVVPYEEVDAAFAWDGGEDDRSLESWRQIYWEFIAMECARIGRPPSHETPLVCERFRVVYSEPLKSGVSE
jgi:uncharacterized protein YhfF